MRSRWGAVNELMSELRGLRDDRRGLEAAAAPATIGVVDRLIARAVEAVDVTLSPHAGEDRFIDACEAIVTARERIDALRRTARRSAAIAAHGRALRAHSARLLWRRICGDPPAARPPFLLY